ncbi:glycoside hydrolase family 42 [Aureibaculum marinum]|uniref:Glycoside hydrolase family 42 n=1 Tax=Aureibaculum marinum TaxID=2487930 RepID=A0A3N4NDD5_9FLAO|nr:alpha-amylase family protein [Aureibaculum marinum]RPD93365.1 glycoside hydrolase family 42 [Aureibaculum marinum]
MKKNNNSIILKLYFILSSIFMFVACAQENKLTIEATKKIEKLESLMDEAKSKSIDVTREETTLWFSKEFLKFANWDEAHFDEIEKLFGYYQPFTSEKTKYAQELPDFERKKVIEILDKGILNLKKELDGSLKRRPVSKVDWQNIKVKEDMFVSYNKPVFLYDYFSKTVGQPLTNTSVYNNHLGAIYHGGSTLYEVNQDRAINPFILNEDGTFDQEKLKLITDIPDTNVGFMILWNMGMPDWAHKKDPELADGRSLFTGFDIDNPTARQVWSDVIQKAGSLTKGKKVTQMGYVLSNEPHWFSEKNHWTARFNEMTKLSSYTLNKFREWLAKKYNGEIDELNKNWISDFENFGSVEIEIPIDKIKRGTPIWYDWCRYNMDRSIDWFTFLQNQLRITNPDADTSIKIMPNMFTENARSHGIDLEALTELTSMIGDDAKIRERHIRKQEPEEWEERYSYFWEEMSVAYDFMESVSPNKIHFNSESHYLSASNWRKLDVSSDYVRSTTWLSTLHGMDAQLAWFWARDPDGSPEDRLEGELDFFDPALAGSFAGSVNMQPHVANEYTQVMMDLNSFSEEMFAFRKQRRPIRLFYSETSAINKKSHMTELFPMYEALYFEGFPMGYVTENIITKQDNSNWDVILVYKTEYVTDNEFNSLQSYLDQGGTVMIDSKESLSKNEYGKYRTKSLNASKGKLIVLNLDLTPNEIKDKVLNQISESLPEVILTESNGSEYKGCTWRVVKNPKGGYLMNILNIGKNSAVLKIIMKNGQTVNATDLLTGQKLGSIFTLKSNGVLLIEIK